MAEIPVSFDYNGEHYDGVLSEVKGSGAPAAWHLMINRFYCGQLNFNGTTFEFTSQTGKFEEMSEYFGEMIMLWYQ